MNWWHDFPCLLIAGSVSLLGLTTLDALALAEVEVPQSATIEVNSPLQTVKSSTSTNTLTAQTPTPAIPPDPAFDINHPITSVTQLSDVQPSDWAFPALQSLIERYGVIAGYPDSTYQGNRAMTRYEFAAALNAALERVNELIATGLEGQVLREDVEILQRLQQEYAVELTNLRRRLDNLEARTAELKATQFSTTTKLTGQTIFAINGGGFSGDRLVSPTGTEITDNNPNATVLYRVALDFNTSFFGTDLLKIRLDTGSNGANDNAAGVLEPTFGSVLDFSVKPPKNGEIGIGRIFYTFKPFRDFAVSLGPDIRTTDYVDFNSYANLSFQDFSTLALVNNYILFPINGPSAGAAINWNPNAGPFTLRALYAAADAANPSEQGIITGVSLFNSLLYPNGGGERGLFGDTYQNTVELEYAPSKTFALRLQYSGGNVFANRFNVFGVNFELSPSRKLGFFGRYGVGSYDNTAFGDIEPNYWMAGVAFRDLFVPGAIASIAAGQPFIEGAIGNATQTNFEAFYNLPLSENIQITPLVQVVTNPANQNENGTIFTGTLRTVFSF